MITLTSTHTQQQEIKKSRFIAFAGPAGSVEEALDFVAHHSAPKATHNTWAYKVGPLYRFDDDGEVGGTAGRQILSVIEKQELDHLVVMVIRYYGGIKLGTGGLVRAYSSTASRCLDEAPKKEVLPVEAVEFEVPFELTGIVYHVLDRFTGAHRQEQHGPSGLTLLVEVEQAKADSLRQALVTATRGRVTFHAPKPTENSS
jgi:putative IMPACT (imprinted ancient) family translation regulator